MRRRTLKPTVSAIIGDPANIPVTQDPAAAMVNIQEFIASQNNNIVQGSSEWREARKFTIGGSEIASVIGCNPYCNLKRKIGEKLGVVDNPPRIDMAWGTFFQSVARRVTEDKLAATVLAEDIFIASEKMPEGVSYSPDGIGIVRRDGMAATVLYEFKCPFRRQIIEGDVPSYYIPQVLYGLDVLQHIAPQLNAEYGIYVESKFALLTDAEYEGFTETDGIAVGMVCLYKTAEECNEIPASERNVLRSKRFDDIETAIAKTAENEQYFGSIHYHGSAPNITVEFNEFKQFCEDCGAVPCGYLLWRLEDFNAVTIARERDYIKKNRPAIDYAVNKLREIHASGDIPGAYAAL